MECFTGVEGTYIGCRSWELFGPIGPRGPSPEDDFATGHEVADVFGPECADALAVKGIGARNVAAAQAYLDKAADSEYTEVLSRLAGTNHGDFMFLAAVGLMESDMNSGAVEGGGGRGRGAFQISLPNPKLADGTAVDPFDFEQAARWTLEQAHWSMDRFQRSWISSSYPFLHPYVVAALHHNAGWPATQKALFENRGNGGLHQNQIYPFLDESARTNPPHRNYVQMVMGLMSCFFEYLPRR